MVACLDPLGDGNYQPHLVIAILMDLNKASDSLLAVHVRTNLKLKAHELCPA